MKLLPRILAMRGTASSSASKELGDDAPQE